MGKNNIVSTSDSTILKLKVLAKEKEDIRRRLAVTAKNLAMTAKEKEDIRHRLAVTAKNLATTAKEKEDIRSRLAVTAKNLATTAKEKEDIRSRLAVTVATAEIIRLKDKKIAVAAKKKEGVRQRLAVTAIENKNIETKLIERARDLEQNKSAILNILEDLQADKKSLAEDKVKDEALLASIGEGVVAIDSEGKIILINHVAEQMLGLNAEQVMDNVFFEIWNVLDEKENLVPEAERPITAALKGKTTTTKTTFYYLVSKKQIKFPVAITVSPVILDNKIIGAVEVFRDITKENEIDKAKTEFISLASHQLRTPLTAIGWYIEEILSEELGGLNTEQKDYVTQVKESTQRMIRLVNDLLNVSQLETGYLSLAPEPTDLVKLIQNVIDEETVIAKASNCQLNFVKQKVPQINTDPALIRQVLTNLLSNAVKYSAVKCSSENGGAYCTVEIKITMQEPDIVISVADSGLGIPAGVQSRIFEKFFRADNVSKLTTEGTGLGLYISKLIVETLGGKIWFESKVNKGTIFTFTLPLSGSKERKEKM
jgi:PAS domain S-box-containing protein